VGSEQPSPGTTLHITLASLIAEQFSQHADQLQDLLALSDPSRHVWQSLLTCQRTRHAVGFSLCGQSISILHASCCLSLYRGRWALNHTTSKAEWSWCREESGYGCTVEFSDWEQEMDSLGQKAVGCKWVVKLKHDVDGRMEHFKAHLVTKGYAQKYGINYDEICSPVHVVCFS